MHDSRSRLLLLTALLTLMAAATGCLAMQEDEGSIDEIGGATALASTFEGLEAGSKPGYAAAEVELDSGTWRMDDALIGTSTSDLKSGTRSGRLRESGRMTMLFDVGAGAGTVTVRHGRFGSDASGTWGLFSSQDDGTSWTQVGNSRTTGPGGLSTATFTANLEGEVRFEIRKLDGGANRINIDDIEITDLGGGGGGGGGGTGAEISVHTTLGLPSPASTDDPDSFLSVKAGYAISYNSGRKVPNWVSWELNSSYLGSTDRQDDYRQDSTLPADLPQASLGDYSGSGFDRGHMCPSGDRTLDADSNSETFFLSNMIPQSGNNNRGPWADLETESREIAQSGKELFVVSGGAFGPSSGTIGDGVAVPDETWKVIVVLDAAGQGPDDVTTDTRVIAVMMPNSDSEIDDSADWRDFRVSVDDIEAATGNDLLSDVAPDVQASVEANVDDQ
jgi:endonuclease G, mitochondrial